MVATKAAAKSATRTAAKKGATRARRKAPAIIYRRFDPEVTRTVAFYHAHVEPQLDKPAGSYDPQTLYSAISSLNVGQEHWYVKIGDGQHLCVWPYDEGEYPSLQLGTSRTSGLPHLEKRGEVLPLEIDPEAGLVERTHIVLFPDNIVGVEFNQYGPRINRLTGYLDKTCKELPTIVFTPLVSQDVLAKLQRFRTLRVMTMKIYTPYLQILLGADDSVANALTAVAEENNAPIIEVTLRTLPRTTASLGSRAKRTIERLAKHARLREGLMDLSVLGVDSKTEELASLNLLDDKLVTHRRVVREKEGYRSVDTAEMFREIEEAYRGLRDELRKAAGVG